jgi:phosphinothricin acetyltransferase
MCARIEKTLRTHPWLVHDDAGDILGYAYASKHRERAAYQWSADVSCYVRPHARGRGIGKALYAELLRMLEAQGFRNAYAGIALPNEASVRLHESVGFTPIGVYRGVGFKQGAWRDVGWWGRRLGDPEPSPRPPSPFRT